MARSKEWLDVLPIDKTDASLQLMPSLYTQNPSGFENLTGLF